MKKTNTSISTISIISLLLLTLVVSCSFGFVYYKYQKKKELHKLESHLMTGIHQLSKGLSIAVWNFDEDQVEGILESALLDESITEIVIEYNDWNRTTRAIRRDSDKGFIIFKEKHKLAEDAILLESDIVYSNERIAKLSIYASPQRVLYELNQELGLITLFIILLSLCLVAGVYCIFYYIIIQPLKLLEQFSLSINFGTHNPDLSIEKRFFKEIEHLSFSLQKMVASMNSNYKKIKNSERIFRDMANLLPQGVFEMDSEGNFIFINKVGLNMFDSTKADLDKGITIFDLTASEDHEKLRKNISRVVEGERNVTGNEYKGLKKDGTVFPLVIYSSRIVEEDRVIGLRGIGMDMTLQRKNEAAYNELVQLNFIKEKESEKLRTLSLIEGQEKERLRISREIHDGIGQMMTAVKLNSESINPVLINSEAEIEKLEYTRALISEVITELRQVSSDLSPTFLYDYGLYLAVNQLIKNVSRISTISINLNSNIQNVRLVSLVEITLYRIIQEAINNCVKYSQAKNLKILLIRDAEFLELLVEDDGVGYDLSIQRELNSKGGNGLKNIASRANLIGASSTIITSPGAGFQISVEVPLENTVE